MTAQTEAALTNWLKQLNLAVVPNHDHLQVFGGGCHIGDVNIEVVDTVEMVKIQGRGRSESVPLCSPLVLDMLRAVFGKAPPKWDPIR